MNGLLTLEDIDELSGNVSGRFFNGDKHILVLLLASFGACLPVELGQGEKVWFPMFVSGSRNPETDCRCMSISNGRKIEFNRVVMRKYVLANGGRFPPGYMSALFAKFASLEKPRVATRVTTNIFENGLEIRRDLQHDNAIVTVQIDITVDNLLKSFTIAVSTIRDSDDPETAPSYA